MNIDPLDVILWGMAGIIVVVGLMTLVIAVALSISTIRAVREDRAEGR